MQIFHSPALYANRHVHHTRGEDRGGGGDHNLMFNIWKELIHSERWSPNGPIRSHGCHRTVTLALRMMLWHGAQRRKRKRAVSVQRRLQFGRSQHWGSWEGTAPVYRRLETVACWCNGCGESPQRVEGPKAWSENKKKIELFLLQGVSRWHI